MGMKDMNKAYQAYDCVCDMTSYYLWWRVRDDAASVREHWHLTRNIEEAVMSDPSLNTRETASHASLKPVRPNKKGPSRHDAFEDRLSLIRARARNTS